jgi:hypothetical protein
MPAARHPGPGRLLPALADVVVGHPHPAFIRKPFILSRQTPPCRRSQQGGGGNSGCKPIGFHVSQNIKWNAAHPNPSRHSGFFSYLYKQNYHEIQTFFASRITMPISLIYNVLQIIKRRGKSIFC